MVLLMLLRPEGCIFILESRLPTFYVLITDYIKREKKWCLMNPCKEGEACELYMPNNVVEGWVCTKDSQKRTVKVSFTHEN